jgi:hypothetical protein
MTMKDPQVLGRKVSVNFVDIPLESTTAKIDTGAYHNAIHCSNVVVEKIDGKRVLSFYVLDASHPDFKDKKIIVEDFSRTIVKNSFGEFQRRYVVKLRFRIHGIKKIYHSSFTLADRSRMKIPVLIGRKFLKRGFLVDVTKE